MPPNYTCSSLWRYWSSCTNSLYRPRLQGKNVDHFFRPSEFYIGSWLLSHIYMGIYQQKYAKKLASNILEKFPDTPVCLSEFSDVDEHGPLVIINYIYYIHCSYRFCLGTTMLTGRKVHLLRFWIPWAKLKCKPQYFLLQVWHMHLALLSHLPLTSYMHFPVISIGFSFLWFSIAGYSTFATWGKYLFLSANNKSSRNEYGSTARFPEYLK